MSLASALIARAAAAPTPPAAPGSLDLLNALRDIHEPPPPGLWPPAPGWWLLAALVIAALVALVLYLRRRQRRARPVRAGLAELDQWIAKARAGGDPAAHAERLAALLRRVALLRYPRAEVAALTGEAWLRFLDRTSGTDAFTRGPGRVLGDERYAPSMTLDVDVLGALARRWLQEHLDGPGVQIADAARNDAGTQPAAAGPNVPDPSGEQREVDVQPNEVGQTGAKQTIGRAHRREQPSRAPAHGLAARTDEDGPRDRNPNENPDENPDENKDDRASSAAPESAPAPTTARETGHR